MAETVNPCDCEPMQIKTIVKRLDNTSSFDKEVNEALADGWILKRRILSNPISQPNDSISYRMLVAELVKNESSLEDPAINEMEQIERFLIMMKNLSDVEARD